MGKTISKIYDFSGMLKRVIMSLIGVTLISFGLAFNSIAGLGNDPLAVFFDGVRNVMRLSQDKLGTAIMVLNIVLGIIVFILGRKYIKIGTFIYVLPMGLLTNFGFVLYSMLGIPTDVLIWRIVSVTLGCLMIFTGLALFIVADIGLDPWTGSLMIIRDKINKPYKSIKVATDIMFVIVGYIMGGVAGWATLVAALVGGPCIQWICKLLENTVCKWFKIKE